MTDYSSAGKGLLENAGMVRAEAILPDALRKMRAAAMIRFLIYTRRQYEKNI